MSIKEIIKVKFKDGDETFFKKYKQPHEKMLTIISCQGNAGQNHNEIPRAHTHTQDGFNQK